MTNLTNYHSHCLYCDGRANMEDFIRFAISEGFTSYGISSHAPLPFSTAWTMEWDRMDDYLSEFSRLKKKYADKIELAIGLEIDYLNEESNPSLPCFQKLPLDYRIGSVHMLYSPEGKIVDIDTPADLFRQFIIRKSKFPQNPKRSVRFSGKRTKRSVQKRKAHNTQKAETKVL